MKIIMVIVGTRPELVKLSPVISELNKHADKVKSVVCSTGQHDDLLTQNLDVFNVKFDYELGIMRPDQQLSALTSRLIMKLDKVVDSVKPDLVLAEGDTATVLASAIISLYHKIKFAHVEAGLRTGQKFNPFPEETTRIIADHTADLLFAPTQANAYNLRKEGIKRELIHVTGNTVIDSMKYMLKDYPTRFKMSSMSQVLVTVHRRENFGQPVKNICHAIKLCARRFPRVIFIVTVHPNPNIEPVLHKELDGFTNIALYPPLNYVDLIGLLRKTRLVCSDSGGLTEESVTLGVPLLILRDYTERQEAVRHGYAKLVGTDVNRIVNEVTKELKHPTPRLTKLRTLYGDGHAAQRIVKTLLNEKS